MVPYCAFAALFPRPTGCVDKYAGLWVRGAEAGTGESASRRFVWRQAGDSPERGVLVRSRLQSLRDLPERPAYSRPCARWFCWEEPLCTRSPCSSGYGVPPLASVRGAGRGPPALSAGRNRRRYGRPLPGLTGTRCRPAAGKGIRFLCAGRERSVRRGS